MTKELTIDGPHESFYGDKLHVHGTEKGDGNDLGSLDWNETHCTFDGTKWTADFDALETVVDHLEARGFDVDAPRNGTLTYDLDPETATEGDEITVVYTPWNGNEQTREGIVTANDIDNPTDGILTREEWEDQHGEDAPAWEGRIEFDVDGRTHALVYEAGDDEIENVVYVERPDWDWQGSTYGKRDRFVSLGGVDSVETASTGSENEGDRGDVKAAEVQPGQVYETSGGERVEVRNDDGPGSKVLRVGYPERTATANEQHMSRYSFADMANYDGFTLVDEDADFGQDDDDDNSDRMDGEWNETPRCPNCSRFMSRDYDGEGFPAAQCSRIDCGGWIGVSGLIEDGYFEEGAA